MIWTPETAGLDYWHPPLELAVPGAWARRSSPCPFVLQAPWSSHPSPPQSEGAENGSLLCWQADLLWVSINIDCHGPRSMCLPSQADSPPVSWRSSESPVTQVRTLLSPTHTSSPSDCGRHGLLGRSPPQPPLCLHHGLLVKCYCCLSVLDDHLGRCLPWCQDECFSTLPGCFLPPDETFQAPLNHNGRSMGIFPFWVSPFLYVR